MSNRIFGIRHGEPAQLKLGTNDMKGSTVKDEFHSTGVPEDAVSHNAANQSDFTALTLDEK